MPTFTVIIDFQVSKSCDLTGASCLRDRDGWQPVVSLDLIQDLTECRIYQSVCRFNVEKRSDALSKAESVFAEYDGFCVHEMTLHPLLRVRHVRVLFETSRRADFVKDKFDRVVKGPGFLTLVGQSDRNKFLARYDLETESNEDAIVEARSLTQAACGVAVGDSSDHYLELEIIVVNSKPV